MERLDCGIIGGNGQSVEVGFIRGRPDKNFHYCKCKGVLWKNVCKYLKCRVVIQTRLWKLKHIGKIKRGGNSGRGYTERRQGGVEINVLETLPVEVLSLIIIF